jgi:transcriptional regulator with XRE-family HTH domain
MNSPQQLREIGLRLREQRKELHLTQAKMAEKIGMSTNYYGQIERGKKGLSIEKLILCHNELAIDLNYLITGKGEAKNKIDDLLNMVPGGKMIPVKKLIKMIYELCR